MNAEDQTIKDFGKQWLRYSDNEGYYGSLELFSDILSPFLKTEDLKNCKVAEIGSGAGRIVNMLLESGVQHVVAVEPSDAFAVLVRNIRNSERATCLKMTGDQLPAYGDLDYIFSIGVLHHIPDPKPVVEAAFRALRPGGQFFVWLYGIEGNELYLALIQPLRVLTRRLPHLALSSLVWLVYYPLNLYTRLCHRFPLPLKEYLLSILEKMSPEKQRLIIYDQLNPAYAKYYTRQEAIKLLEDGRFVNVRVHHRHGYSWTVIGTKP
ncbi:MAG: class I SAM-dependent methyltransferase [Thermodesulfobacteriota bacterium]|nr:class I SAM-dependent methyltransferase [Thermodesulfobacteriota bacterium]